MAHISVPNNEVPGWIRWAATRDHTLLWRLLSLGLFAGAWEIAGQIPINYALPPFSQTFMAFVGMVLDGSLIGAYATTLQPLLIGIAISAVLGCPSASLWDCGRWRNGWPLPSSS